MNIYTEDFTDLTGFSGNGNGTVAADTTYKYLGTQSAKLTAGTGGNFLWQKPNYFNIDLSQPNTWMRIVYYLPQDMTGSLSLQFYLFDASSDSDYSCQVGGDQVKEGWHCVDYKVAAAHGNWNPASIKGLGVYFVGGTGEIIYLDSIQFLRPDANDLPTFVFTFDDGNPESYTVFAPELEKYGWRGCFNVIGSLIGQAGRMTLAQTQELYARGHIIASHSYTHPDFAAATDGEAEYEVLRNQQWLRDNGMPKNADIFCVPYSLTGWTQARINWLMSLNRVMLNNGTVFPPRYNSVDGISVKYYAPHQYRNLWGRTIDDRVGSAGLFSSTVIDSRIAGSCCGINGIMIHDVDGGGYFSTQNYKDACAHLRQKELAGLCRVMTVNDFANGAAPTPINLQIGGGTGQPIGV